MEKITRFFTNYKTLIILYVLFAIIASSQSYFLGAKKMEPNGKNYTQYNNYLIFKYSYFHLRDGKDLYIHYPDEHFDLYKYSPAFSIFFGAFTIMPDIIGLNLWNILNALILLFAIYYLPVLNLKQKGLVLLAVLIELMTSMQNEQSNGLVAGLIILAFGLLEKKHYFIAVFCIVFSAFIKLFGIVALLLLLFYPKKWKLAIYTLFWIAFLAFVPLVLVNFATLKFEYSSWLLLLSMDHDASIGYSVMGWIQSWSGVPVNKLLVVGLGTIILCIPYLKFKKYNDYYFKLLSLSGLLIWMVVFNHKAESPTFIIAFCGVSMWLISQKTSTLNLALFWVAFVLTTLSPTDIFPKFLREEYVKPYALKAVPCILIWGKIIYELILEKYRPKTIE